MAGLKSRSSSSRALLLAGVCTTSLLAIGWPAAAFAQQAAETQPAEEPAPADTAPTPGDPAAAPGDDNTIVVTGIREGVRSSVNIKRREQGIVEAVSAEDIGKLPDISIAESISRLPGLAAQRIGGRSTYISIRGLAPDFTTTLLNGRQQASSGDNRAVEFDQYPSELLQSVVIYKTPDANIAGFGLSGTADLRTVRPLSYGKKAIALNLRGEVNTGDKLNDDVRKHGWRASVSYIDQLTPELGIALGAAYLNSPSSNRHTKAYGYERFDSDCFYDPSNPCGLPFPDITIPGVRPESARNALFLNGQEIFATSRINKRLAGIAILEWEPSDQVHTTLDLYYSRFKQRETMRGAQWFSNPWTGETYFDNVQTADQGGTELAVSGTTVGVLPQLRNDYNTRDDWLFSAGLNNEFKLTDELRFIADLSYSSNKRKETYTETYAGFGCCETMAEQNATRHPDDMDSISWDISGNGFPQFSGGFDYGDVSQVSLGDRAPWGGWGHDGLTKSPHVKERIYAADGGLRYEPAGIDWLEAVDVGANYTRRHKDKTVDERDMFLKNDRLEVLVDDDLLVSPTSLGFAGFGNVIAYDVREAMERYYDFLPTEDSAHFDKAWDIKEDVLTLKARAQFSFGNLHGNVGIQAVHQKQTSSGQRINFLTDPPELSDVKEGDSYWDVLPSLNAYYDFGGGHRLRFAAAKVLARPRMDEMRANLTPSFNNNPCSGGTCVPGQDVHPWSATGGNPDLQPWRAKALDVSYEWYIGPASYIAIAGFYKKLDNYIYTRVVPFDFSDFEAPELDPSTPPGVIVSPIGTITMPDNGPGGSIKGIEISGALELGRITKFLDGFGVLGSVSKTKSSLNPTDNSGEDVRIPGLSGTVANLTGYFEKAGFQARLSWRYRSKFKGEVVQLFTNRGFTEILADKQVDAQIGYTFPEGRFKDLGFLLQVYNLTNSPYRTRLGLDAGGPTTENGDTFIETYEKYGRQILFGVNYRF